KTVLDDTLGIPVILLISNPSRYFDYFLKRFFDIILSLILLIFSTPIFIIVAICIKLESTGPVFYKQTRIGYKRKKFCCYKFRSMCQNAEEKIENLKKDDNTIFFKMENDPRITKVGKFIRKYSIDEMPQFFNVLKGDMSLVGPRPMIEMEILAIEKKYHNYNLNKLFKVMPGITGLWQVSGRSILNDEKRLELDLFYIDNWSLNFDLKILLKTVIAILFHKGAY
ncbi:MAG: exopolysaccharide biosynthesis polyprenyl glycosylphosphotransferase, partial [Endomicrobiaceae bacterium]|nr:exopolysaccharide biosynthesis polyprenyl glycosylphosphotransferase [Endomicrobiaceae bacterium]